MKAKTICLLFILVAINCFLDPPAQAADDKKEREAIVSSFKKLVLAHIASYDKNKRVQVYHAGDGWAKASHEAEKEYSIDIQSTTSLVSPYTATFEFVIDYKITDFHQTKEEAEGDSQFKRALPPKKHRHIFAYQDGKWVIKTRENYEPILKEWFDCNGKDDEGNSNVYSCFEIEEKPTDSKKPVIKSKNSLIMPKKPVKK